ncbi:FCD domain-containing protein [Nocardioides panzhihuensis]|uniref:DNA-binding FadR family transcriptional regulator n=1 Tax=Nocardioides panzhihuensis TaxID=860243 RepID=A0A7Z0DKC8_9ACTN|nr:DNA-binding FadR family transcriptional regulator [Nocardioides panzhihuensis]
MPLSATTSRSLVDQAIDGMRDLLADGEWTVGTRIPAEPELAAALGVSRNTVREAVRALAHTGVLEVRRGDGTYVAAANEVAAMMRRRVGRVDPQHVLEVRQAIETQAAALAAERRSEDDMRALTELMERRAAATAAKDADAFADADAEFHLGVVTATHNPLLIELYAGFEGNLRTMIHLGDETTDLADAHVAVFDAIRTQDPGAAVAAVTGLLHTLGR